MKTKKVTVSNGFSNDGKNDVYKLQRTLTKF
jgi:hypothetical protein